MTRFTAVAVLGLAMIATACDKPLSPEFGKATPVSTPAMVLVGIVEKTDEEVPRLGLRRGDALTLLTGNIDALEAHVGAPVRVAGNFGDDGLFVVASFTMEQRDGGAATNRTP
jgi:hypothetical protein